MSNNINSPRSSASFIFLFIISSIDTSDSKMTSSSLWPSEEEVGNWFSFLTVSLLMHVWHLDRSVLYSFIWASGRPPDCSLSLGQISLLARARFRCAANYQRYHPTFEHRIVMMANLTFRINALKSEWVATIFFFILWTPISSNCSGETFYCPRQLVLAF